MRQDSNSNISFQILSNERRTNAHFTKSTFEAGDLLSAIAVDYYVFVERSHRIKARAAPVNIRADADSSSTKNLIRKKVKKNQE